MTVNFTHLDKIFWPKEQYSKGDVIAYYRIPAMAPVRFFGANCAAAWSIPGKAPSQRNDLS
jgi:DNA primase